MILISTCVNLTCFRLRIFPSIPSQHAAVYHTRYAMFNPQAERTTERSEVVRASENEVFALLDRTGTGQCPVAVFGTALASVGLLGVASPGRQRAAPGGPSRSPASFQPASPPNEHRELLSPQVRSQPTRRVRRLCVVPTGDSFAYALCRFKSAHSAASDEYPVSRLSPASADQIIGEHFHAAALASNLLQSVYELFDQHLNVFQLAVCGSHRRCCRRRGEFLVAEKLARDSPLPLGPQYCSHGWA